MRRNVLTGILLTLFLASTLTITLHVQPVKAEPGTIYIRADGSVDPPTAPVSSVDNVTYIFAGNIDDSIVVERDNIVIDGAGYTVQGAGSGVGINMTMRSNVTIKNIEIKTFLEGISLGYSSNIIISGNKIEANSYSGIVLVASSNNTISGNKIEANNGCGIELIHSSNNSISGNNITNNNYGVRLQQSSNNTFRHNNFINNKQQVLIVSSGYANFWDTGYPSGGNYWSDYKGIDLYSGPYQNETGSDEIGDTSYVIYTLGEERDRDRYPLIYPRGLPLAPRAIFSCSSSTLTPNETVTFNASASVPGWNGTHRMPIVSYVWDFGDSSTGTGLTTTHIYTAEGNYTVILNVTDSQGLWDTASKTVKVSPLSPPPCPYAKVHLVDQADWTRWNLTNVYSPGDSFTLDVIIENVTDLYGWDIGAVWDPSILTCTGFTEGTFLTSSGYPTLGIDGTIDNVAGKIDPMYGRALKGAPKGQNGSSTDPGKGALASMDFIIDPTLVYYDKTWINLTITLWDSRMKPITMTVNHAFWLYPPPPHGPIAHFTYSPNDAFINVNTTFDASASSPGWSGTVTIPIAEYTWDFGDGTQVTTTNPAVTHTYTAVGNYTVTLTVTDDKGNWNTITQTATVNLAEFSLVALYTLHLDLNYWSSEGAKLTAAFYTYEGVYQGNMTVWTGETPTWVELSTDIVHPQGKPIEIVKLVLTDDFGNVLHTVISYAIRRSDLMGTLGELDHLWTVPGADRTAIMKEYVTIDGQWSYAPP